MMTADGRPFCKAAARPALNAAESYWCPARSVELSRMAVTRGETIAKMLLRITVTISNSIIE